MSSIDNAEKSRSNAALSQKYAQQRDDIVRTEEDRLKNLREGYQKKAQEEQQHGQAYVNHIKADNDQRANELKNQGRQRDEDLRKDVEQKNKVVQEVQSEEYKRVKEAKDQNQKLLSQEGERYS
jgi:hypothetical protein